MSKRNQKKSSVPAKKQAQKPPSASAPATPVVPGCLTITSEEVERLIAEAHYQQHPYGKVWQRFDLDIFSELVRNIDRRGLDQEILLYQEMILEGWHRYLACLHTKTQPKFVEFKGTDLEAAERVHASGVRRQSTAEQRYASFDLLCQACPAFREKYEQLKQKGIEQQQAGTPLSTDGQRVDVVKAKAAAAGVSRATAAKVEKVKKEKPEAVADIAAGKTSANKVLKKIKKDKGLDKPSDGSPVAATSQRPPLDELKDITRRFENFLQVMDGVDWSREDDKEWDDAGETVSRAAACISRKAQEGFVKAKENKTPTKDQRQKFQGKEITSRKLKALYGNHAETVLHEYLKNLPRKKGAMQSYRIVKALPDTDEFNGLQTKLFTSNVADLVDSAFSTFEDLAGEMSDWYDGLPEAFQGGDKGSALEDARGILESLSHPAVDGPTGAIEVCYLPLQDVKSRASRCNDAVGCLQAVVDALDACKDDEGRDNQEEIKNLLDELENAISEAEGVEFPGMYG